MVLFASIVACLAFAGAAASWGMGAWFHARALRKRSAERRQSYAAWLTVVIAMVSWPFAPGGPEGAAAAHAAKANKALVAFFACLTIAVAATSVATNLARVSR